MDAKAMQRLLTILNDLSGGNPRYELYLIEDTDTWYFTSNTDAATAVVHVGPSDEVADAMFFIVEIYVRNK